MPAIVTYRQFGHAPTHKREQIRIAQLRHQQFLCGLRPLQVEPEDRHLLYVDHCHTSDRLRGLLCPSCNGAMAAVDRGDEWLMRAVQYREQGIWYVQDTLRSVP